jgi:uncharacterized protein (TIGR02271 family)
MSWSGNASQIQVGDDVYGNDGEKIGSVAEVQSSYLVIEKGFFFPTDYYIPVNAITQVQDGQVMLNVSKDAALHSGWDTVPDATTVGIGQTDTVYTDVVETTMPVGGQSQVAGYEATSEEEIVIPLREEELTASVREVEAGAARIQKRVVAEDRVLEVPVTEEQIRVERRVVDRAAGVNDADAFEEIVIEVPLTQEEVELRKQSRVTEELVVSKEAIQHTEQVRGTVRREEVDVVEDATVIRDIDGGTTPRR